MPRFGVIDLGSNSIRLVIYKIYDRRERRESKRRFRAIVDEKKIAGLSAYVQDGIFSQEGIDAAAEVLSDDLRRARNLDCEDVRIFATAFLRNCLNSKEATRAIRKAIGQDIEVLSAHDEAHLGFVGVTSSRAIKSGTLVDIGGGSTELTAIKSDVGSHCASIPQGSVSSYAQFVDTILPTKREIRAMDRAFRKRLASLDDIEAYHTNRLYGIGGAPRAATKLYGTAFCEGRRPKELTLDQLDEVLALLAHDPSSFAHFAVKAAPDRLHTLVPGCIIINALMRELGARRIEVCKNGVREGYLIERILEGKPPST